MYFLSYTKNTGVSETKTYQVIFYVVYMNYENINNNVTNFDFNVTTNDNMLMNNAKKKNPKKNQRKV